jgi:hypothetical protein
MTKILWRGKPVSRWSIMRFGKHKGRRLKDILARDPGYIVWVAENTTLPVEEDLLNEARFIHNELERLRNGS